MRNGSIWSNIVFVKEVIFQEFDFETSELDFEISKSSIWKHTTSCDKGVFFTAIIISQLQRPIEFKLSQACYFVHISWDAPSENTGLQPITNDKPTKTPSKEKRRSVSYHFHHQWSILKLWIQSCQPGPFLCCRRDLLVWTLYKAWSGSGWVFQDHASCCTHSYKSKQVLFKSLRL